MIFLFLQRRTLKLREGNLLQSHNGIFTEPWSISPFPYAKPCLKHGKEVKQTSLRQDQHKNLKPSILNTVFPNSTEMSINFTGLRGRKRRCWGDTVIQFSDYSELTALSWPYFKSIQTTSELCLAPRLLPQPLVWPELQPQTGSHLEFQGPLSSGAASVCSPVLPPAAN